MTIFKKEAESSSGTNLVSPKDLKAPQLLNTAAEYTMNYFHCSSVMPAASDFALAAAMPLPKTSFKRTKSPGPS